MRNYGIENFLFEIIEECSIDELNEKEIEWINYYDSNVIGYNQTEGGNSSPIPQKLTLEKVEEIYDLLFNTSIPQYQIAKKFNVDQTSISNINVGKTWFNENIDYPIRKKVISINYCKNCGKKISRGATYCSNCIKKYPSITFNKNQVINGELFLNLNKGEVIIYKIINDINNYIYIGSTSLSLEKALYNLFKDSQRDKAKRALFEAFKEYGYNNFKIEGLEKVSDENKNEKIMNYIKKYHSYVNFQDSKGYNETLKAGCKQLYNYEELANKYLELKSVKQVSNFFNCSLDTVRKACKEMGVEILPNKKKASKSIKRIDPITREEVIFNSISDAAKLSFPDKPIETARKNISSGLNHHRKAYGFLWELTE